MDCYEDECTIRGEDVRSLAMQGLRRPRGRPRVFHAAAAFVLRV